MTWLYFILCAVRGSSVLPLFCAGAAVAAQSAAPGLRDPGVRPLEREDSRLPGAGKAASDAGENALS